MICSNPDLLPKNVKAAEMDSNLLEFYEMIKGQFKNVFVNVYGNQRYNDYCGWRPAECTVGAKNSAHKQGKALDLHLALGEDLEPLRKFCCSNGPSNGIYRMESKLSTPTWVHIDTIKKLDWDYKKGIYVFNP